jgi:uncharacterized membrane protein YjfL (UPF0719 family)
MEYFVDLGTALLYGGVGLVLMVVGFVVIDLLTPGKLGRIIVDERNRTAALVAGAALLAVGAIVTAAIVAAEGNLGEGLAQAAGYGLVGILLMGIAFKVIDLMTPGHLGRIVVGEGDQPVSYVIGAALVSIGAILAAAIS